MAASAAPAAAAPVAPAEAAQANKHLQQLEDEVGCSITDKVRHVEAARERAPKRVPWVTWRCYSVGSEWGR
jgi:hypothetical protein